MGITLKFDTRQMKEALRAYGQVTRKTASEAVNHKMRDVLSKTLASTPIVTAAQISSELRAPYVNLAEAFVRTGKRKGQVRKHPKVRYNPYPLARAIIAARLIARGTKPRSFSGQAFTGKIDAMIASRMSSGAYAMSGWLPAAKLFGAGMGYGSVPIYKPHGDGILATLDNAIAEVRNDAIADWDSGSRGFQEVFQAAQDALNDVGEETLGHVERKLMEAWKRTFR